MTAQRILANDGSHALGQSVKAATHICRLRRQQRSQMTRVESRRYQQAATIAESYFNRYLLDNRFRRCRQAHGNEFCRVRLAQPFLPRKPMRGAQSPLAAKCCHTLSTLRLFGNQLPPLPPRPLAALTLLGFHPTRLLTQAALMQDVVC